MQHKAAFDLYVRSGETAGLKVLEAKALSAGSGPDGGYLVPPPAEREILKRMTQISPIRALASVREVSTATFKKAYSTDRPGDRLGGGDGGPAADQQPVIAELNFPTMELYAMPSATQTLLDDAVVDIEAWIADEVETVFAEQEGVRLRQWRRRHPAAGLPRDDEIDRRRLGLGQARLCPDGGGRGFRGRQPVRQPGGPHLFAEGAATGRMRRS